MRSILILICLISFSACSGFQPNTTLPDRSNLTYWSNEDEKINVVQQITGNWKGQHFLLQVYLTITLEKMDVIILDSLGRRGMTASWNNDGMTTWKAAWMPDYFNPQYMMWDIATAFWPKELLEEDLDNIWQIKDTGNLREVFYDGDKVSSVIYKNVEDSIWTSIVILQDHSFNYELNIKSREVSQ
ncbi:DUF3261 domain-containing protein [Curvivirga sp.]|uniref:DUF3261 domain-containing protein n=1 Tax=Curvivirga sp. TaxID=2856848 RepID=UPI003B59B80F